MGIRSRLEACLSLFPWYRRRARQADLARELRDHLELEAEEQRAAGLSREEAGHAAHRALGNVMRIEEDVRAAWGFRWLDALLQDLRYGLRMLAKSPGFTATAVLILALGIGANTAIFSVVNGVLLRPLAFPRSNRLVAITDGYPQGSLEFMRANFHSMQVAGYWMNEGMNLAGFGSPARLDGEAVSANFFSVLGTHAELGRTFLPGEDLPGKDGVVVLSHALWEHKFAGNSNVIGRTISLEGRIREIVGVMPANFELGSSKPQLWVPLHMDPRDVGAYWGGGFVSIIGRLRPGATLAQARSELRANIPQMRTMFPWKMPDALWADSTVIPLRSNLVGSVRTKLLILLGAVGLVLLIACANVANLLLTRAVVRQKEMALRVALGAGTWRICAQAMTESLLLSLLGGAFGVVAAFAGFPVTEAALPANTPRLAGVGMDWRVLAFAVAVALLTGLLFGLAPALHMSHVDLNESLKSGWRHSAAHRSQRLRAALAVSEMALAVVLVVAAGLLVRSLWNLSRVYPGFQTESVVSARVTPSATFCANWARCRGFYAELLRRVRALPGVRAAAMVNVLPLSGRTGLFAASLEGHPQDPREPAPVLFESIISTDYFRVMEIPLLRGRVFTEADFAPGAPPVALVTESTAQKFWPNQDPVGKHFKREWLSKWTTIVGVVGDVNEESLASRLPSFADGAVYEPYGGNASVGLTQPAQMTLVLRSAPGTAEVAREVRTIVSRLDSEIPVTDVTRLAAVVSHSESGPRSTMSLFVVFAALALVLGAMGIYGVISYSVTQRTAEIGMRMALGAQKQDILQLVMGQSARIALSGIVLGSIGALAVSRLMSSLLFGISPADPMTYFAVAVVLTLAAGAAAYVPARRAMRVDPVAALRNE